MRWYSNMSGNGGFFTKNERMKYNAETGPTDGERTSGYEFMKHRIRKILLVCCSYDGYILEEDGHIEQQINQEYIDLNMSNPPALLRVSSARTIGSTSSSRCTTWANPTCSTSPRSSRSATGISLSCC